MTTLKEQLQADLTSAMRERDQVRAGSLRMALTAVTNEEVAGKEHHELTDDDVLKVLTKEAKKRREASGHTPVRVARARRQGGGGAGRPRGLPAEAARPTTSSRRIVARRSTAAGAPVWRRWAWR